MGLLFAHAFLAISSIAVGLLAMRAGKFSSSHPRLGEIYHWLMLATCLSALALSYSRGRATIFTYLTPPSYGFALVGYLMAKYRPANWLVWHIIGQTSSYLALVTGVFFQLVPRIWRSDIMFLGFSLDFWITLITPGFIGSFFIGDTLKKWSGVKAAKRRVQTFSELNSTGE
ncbi:MAG TPA: hypothetical protein VK210_05040 [Terriglobia bacterium]|nr:hypothetical protein [Terriglobia bacterium]